MKRVLTEGNELILDTGIAVLRQVQPLLNGDLIRPSSVELIENTENRLELRYTAVALRGGYFGLELVQGDRGADCWLRYWLEELPDELVLNSFGLCFAEVENLRAYLRQGYNSWDGSYYVEPGVMKDISGDQLDSETGYAMTQILPIEGNGCLILGFDRHDRYQQTFTFDTRQRPISLRVQTLWDQKERKNISRCESERLMFFTHDQVEGGLREWARIVGAASPTPPRVPGEPLTGWCSWYNLYSSITEENILGHLNDTAAVARKERLSMRIFQIDDGFTPEMGDWLEVKSQFPRGMKALLDDIRAAGFIPGLWIAPFTVGNRSRLYQQHPDWVVMDRETGGPLIQMRFYGEFRWHKRSEEYYILDTTHPDAFAYLRQVFRTWRHDWGCGYFKTDFMHFGSEHGPDRARWHTPGLTRIEIWRHTAEMIRKEIGDALWLGCGCPLWASVGLVDGVRLSRDAGVKWEKESTVALLRDLATRNFANHILWQGDPDCVLLRDKYHYLQDEEVRSLAVFAGMCGGVMMTSDRLGELSPERLQLWQQLLSGARSGCEFPLLGEKGIIYARLSNGQEGHRDARAMDPVSVQVRHPQTEDEEGAIFLFNTSARTIQCSYDLPKFGIAKGVRLVDWLENKPFPINANQIKLELPAHGGRLFLFRLKPVRPTE